MIEKVITIYFSKDRPIQLDLCLRSNKKFSKDWDLQKETVIFRGSSPKFVKGYEEVAKEHPTVRFVEEQAFKDDLLDEILGNDYALFVVDDTVFTHEYSLESMCGVLERWDDVLGFSLRLGKNTTYCYPLNSNNEMPSFTNWMSNEPEIIMGGFKWQEITHGDFGYPLEISSSLYRVKDLQNLLENLHYNNPNSLEWALSINTPLVSNKSIMGCYLTSVAFSNPLNRVQRENRNRAGEKSEYSVNSLLTAYNLGKRIDLKPFEGFISTGAHQEVDISFIKD